MRPAPHTTPESRDLLALFREGADAGATEAVMEVSSHALAQGRVCGLTYDVALFTNLTQDHLDFHGTMENYFAAKRMLFDGSLGQPPRVAVVNIDDPHGRELVDVSRAAGARGLYLWPAATAISAPKTPQMTAAGMRFQHDHPARRCRGADAPDRPRESLQPAGAAGAAMARGLTLEQVAAGAAALEHVPGRFQTVDAGQPFTVVVDYAHTDDALRNLIALAREFVGPEQRVITLFGCGGDRDRAKRPKMGRAAGEGSDLVVLTSDNPRSEDPEAIIADALPGLAATGTNISLSPIAPRAIHRALEAARPGDIVLLAGKGHEKEQILARPHHPLRRCSRRRRGAARAAGSARMKLTLEQIARWSAAELHSGRGMRSAAAPPATPSTRARSSPAICSSPSRASASTAMTLSPAAFERGASAAVVARERLASLPDAARQQPLLLVDDPLLALQRLAAAVRRHWGKRVIGITGSAGKTTTKEAVAAVLATRFSVLKSQGNLNNHFGLPLQLLRLEPQHEVAVIEMGMSAAGEITALCRIAAPDWGVVTNVGHAHAEFFPDGVAGIARAKYELVAALPRHGVAILNCDDPYVSQFGRDFQGKVIYFGRGACADPRAESVEVLGAEGLRFQVRAGDEHATLHLHLPGAHNAANAMAALAVGLEAGIPLADACAALEHLRPEDKRGQTHRVARRHDP